jgi:hypothetical protein
VLREQAKKAFDLLPIDATLNEAGLEVSLIAAGKLAEFALGGLMEIGKFRTVQQEIPDGSAIQPAVP